MQDQAPVQTVVLATLNAKYPHAAFGLRYLLANMAELRERTHLREFTIHDRPLDIAEAILAERPSIVGLGVYIWNVEQTRALVELLNRLAPELTLVVGGPEVSHEIDDQPWLAEVDYIIQGEADRAFPELCARIMSGRRPLNRVIDGGLPDLASLGLPYSLYNEHDLRHRVLYVEASRGCPYRCEFCLSSLDKRVRAFPLDELLAAFDELLDRGARRFKFVDRTFNLDIERSAAILEFFLARMRPGLFLHFEMVPDRLPEGLRDLIAQFPAGSLQFEVGIQTLDDEVGKRIARRQNIPRTFENLQFLREHTGVHLHTDLIIGLPGETAESFGAGLDRLIAAGVQEVQVGLLKRLRGTPIARHAAEFGMVFEPRTPYGVLSSHAIDFATMQRLRRFAQVWDAFWNRGDLPSGMRRLWREGSPFERTLAFSDWLFAEAGRVHSISLENRARYLAQYLIETLGESSDEVCAMIEGDFKSNGRRAPRLARQLQRATAPVGLPERQRRHLR
ncbi:coproporphyrinogen III oxidase [Enhygromyxa salina]|uniref:Coproporphyrinogen III oxidase n=1 Tax=Enhygromyxa salina TaxID=215803 RepID=A0A2S9YGT3_9BACT|nr:B12-binding domain-containing radical SAM protein [Enhygromyxa salina]PRQ04310.1 coproporphyrinogen III oxidase [Enhygromyxa salina]